MQMNVVMPTAMTSMHTDPELSNNAAKTAKRGIRVLKYLQDKDDSVKTNCDAIRAVATGNGADSCVEERVEVSKEKEGGITICLVGSIFCDRVHYVFIAFPNFCIYFRCLSTCDAQYWAKFFENYGYGDREKEGIAEAMQEFD